MNFHPGTYPVPQMSQQQMAYGSPANGQRTPMQMPPQQSPAQNQFYPPGFMPNNRPPMPQQHQMQGMPDQGFQLNQPYQQQMQQPSPSFFPPGNNGQVPNSMAHMPSMQGFNPNLQNQVGNSGHPGAHLFQSADQQTKMNMSQLPQSMAAPVPPHQSATPQPQRSPLPNGGMGQQSHLQNQSQQPGPKAVAQPSPHPPPSPQSIARDRARVGVLLEINAHLLKEIFSLQGQGKAGGASQPLPSPTQAGPTGSPAAASDANSLTTSPKPGDKPSQEYSDCMRRLQANLAFLASQTKADNEKRPPGLTLPPPAILTAPKHLEEVHELYNRLNSLFPSAQRPPGMKMPQVMGGNQIAG